MLVKLRRQKWFSFALVALALLTTLASRIAVAHYLASDIDDDGPVYSQIAVNVLEHHVFSLEAQEPYPPTTIRLPGYPLFLAGVYSVFGHGNNTAVRIVQAVFDTATCVLIALIAWNWVKDEKRRRIAAWAAFILAALCPFTAIHVATILTETMTIFFMAAMTLTATYAFKAQKRKAAIIWWVVTGLLAGICVELRPDSGLFAAAIGFTLVITGRRKSKAEGGRRKAGGKARTLTALLSSFIPHPSALLYGAIFSFAFIIVLVPWTIRNERVFHVFQPLVPPRADDPGEFVPLGYLKWVSTWIDDDRYLEAVYWNVDEKRITVDQVPAFAFDSDEERARVAALFDRYNHPPPEDQDDSADNQPDAGKQADSAKPANEESAKDNSSGTKNQKNAANENKDEDESADDDQSDNDQSDDNNGNADEAEQSQDKDQEDQTPQRVLMTPEIDAGFAQIATERIARAPFRYYVWLPVKRAVALWFDTHSTYYPFSGKLFPWENIDRDENQQFWLPLFMALVWIYTLLALAGAFVLWRTRDGWSRRWLLLAVLMMLPRLVFFSTLDHPEPRYVIELFAFTAIFGGIAIALFRKKTKEASRKKEAS